MTAYDPKYASLSDYILGVTEEIWERRGLHTLATSYAPDIVVRSPGSVVSGNRGVVAATMATLAEFPDRELLGEDVIGCGDAASMLSSHRILSTATHSGSGVYGPASGTRLRYRIIADCHVANGRIDDEWLVRDQGAIVRQLGWDPAAYARELIEREGGPERCARPFTPAIDRRGPYRGAGDADPWGVRYEDLLTRIMNAEFSAIETGYDRACQLELPGGRTEHGRAAADRFWMGLRASFPSARFEVHHRIGRDDPMHRPRAAIRWSLDGRHEGWGAFGEPTGAHVHVFAISHAEFGPRGLAREFVLFDETAIYKQIALATG